MLRFRLAREKFRLRHVRYIITKREILITIISGAPTNHCRSGAGERFSAKSRLRQANGYYVWWPSYGPGELEDGDIVVKSNARELRMCVNLLYRIGLRRWWFVISFQIDVAETHSELASGKAVTLKKYIRNIRLCIL